MIYKLFSTNNLQRIKSETLILISFTIFKEVKKCELNKNVDKFSSLNLSKLPKLIELQVNLEHVLK